MSLRRPLLVLVPLLVPLAAAPLVRAAQTPALQTRFESARLPGLVPARWALVVDADRPIYAEGETLRARATLANFSATGAAAWTMATGGNGCEYHFEIQDGAGNVLWEPGSIAGGVFSGPPCGFGGRQKLLASSDEQGFAATIPLVHQNRAGNGAQGDAIPAGNYHLVVRVDWFGPMTPPADFQSGLGYEARLPFRIE